MLLHVIAPYSIQELPMHEAQNVVNIVPSCSLIRQCECVRWNCVAILYMETDILRYFIYFISTPDNGRHVWLTKHPDMVHYWSKSHCFQDPGNVGVASVELKIHCMLCAVHLQYFVLPVLSRHIGYPVSARHVLIAPSCSSAIFRKSRRSVSVNS